MKALLTAILTTVLAASTSSEAAQPFQSPFHKVSASELPLIGEEGDLASFKMALARQVAKCKTQNLNESFQLNDRSVTRKEWCVDTGELLLKIAERAATFKDLMVEARDTLDWYQTSGRNGKGEVLYTGYNSPVLEASVKPKGEFQFPLYKQPADLVRVVENGKKVWRQKKDDGTFGPYPIRENIDVGGILKGKGLELAHLNDRFEAWILQMEGSGVLLLEQEDGTVKRQFLNYGAQNGHPWTSITQVLREEGVPAEYLSLFGQRKYFKLYPEKLVPTLMKDKSYVFFQFADNGPYGVDSVLLSARHSIAIDTSVFPLEAVTFLQTQRPLIKDGELSGWKDFSTLTVTQDTGGAIKGPGRVDIYWGEDAYASQASGRMAQLGTLFIAVPKTK